MVLLSSAVLLLLLLPGSTASLAAFNTSIFSITLRAATQTIETISPIATPLFSFAAGSQVPADRTGPGNYHVGDITLRVRAALQPLPDQQPHAFAR